VLSDEERKRIERDAAQRLKAQWGAISPRAVRSVVEEIKIRMQEGSWGHLTPAEQMAEIATLSQSADVFGRDERTADHTAEAKGPDRAD
jgi:hypothetical protein